MWDVSIPEAPARQRRAVVAAALACTALLACRPPATDQELLEKVQPVGSWLATLEMAGRKWAANSIPASFVRNAVEAAGTELDKASETAARSRAGAGTRVAVARLAAEAKAAGAGLERAVSAGDRPGAARAADRLAGIRGRFEALQRAGRGAP